VPNLSFFASFRDTIAAISFPGPFNSSATLYTATVLPLQISTTLVEDAVPDSPTPRLPFSSRPGLGHRAS